MILMRYIFLVFFFLPAIFLCQENNVNILLKDGSIVTGKLLKISSEGVEINPGGNVTFRYISAEKIKSVHITDTNKNIDYPVANDNVLKEIDEYQTKYHPYQKIGFPRIFGGGSFGYVSTGDYEYYKGFHGGYGLHLDLYYLFYDSDRQASRFLMGFSYNHSTITGDRIYNIEPILYLNEYSIEIGRTTPMLGNGHFLYLLMGFVVVSNNAQMKISSRQNVTSSLNVTETKYALRIEGDASIAAGGNVSIVFSLGYDMVIGNKEKEKNEFKLDETRATIIGGILNTSAGLRYGFN